MSKKSAVGVVINKCWLKMLPMLCLLIKKNYVCDKSKT